MKKRANHLAFKAQVEQRHEANALLKAPGDAALVHRGVMRSLVMLCPDGCGEQLTINLDARAGKAWRVYAKDGVVSLFPSVWRATGCKSHFILWRSRIYWCDWGDELEAPMEEVVEQVKSRLTDRFESYVEVADSLQLVPWAALSACHRLCRMGFAEAGRGKLAGQFRRTPVSASN